MPGRATGGARPVRAVLTDLDRTLTGPDLVPDPRALDAVRRLGEAGVSVVVVTGRPMEYLVERAFDKSFAGLVAENGAVVRVPCAAEDEVCDPTFRDRARAACAALDGVTWGRVLGSAPREMEGRLRALLSVAKVEHAFEFNADEVMVLPPGVDKARGALRALEILGVDPAEAWAVGDGDNDVALFRCVGASAAVANGSAFARAAATVPLKGAYADGFVECAERVLAARRSPA